MARRRSLLSDATKMHLARLQGAGERAHPGDYGLLTSKEAGSFTKYAIIAAEQALSGQAPTVAPSTTPQAASQPGIAPFPTQRS